jgi:L-iditol 2-dehydrogenase
MRAVVYHGIDDLRLEEIPTPGIGPDEALVRVAACGVCPTDIKKIRLGLLPGPRVYGHETAGTIVKVGENVTQWRPGDRVGVHHHVPCMNCHYCDRRTFAQCAVYRKTGVTAGFEPAGGGYAEYVRVMGICMPGLVRIPDGNTWEEGAMLEPVNTVLKAVKLLGLGPGDTALVAGQGPIGLMFNRLLALEGVRVFGTDLSAQRLAFGLDFGASETFHGGGDAWKAAVKSRTGGRGPDAAVVTAPVDALVHDCHALVRGGGSVMLFAHTARGRTTPVDLSTICVDEKPMLGSYSSDFTLQERVAELVFSRRMDVRRLITHRFGLGEVPAAVALAEKPTAESLKVMVVQERA